jgi:protein-disulfide isomerase
VVFSVRLGAILLAIASVGCSAQAPSQAGTQSGTKIDPELQRKIELQIRNRFSSLPPSVTFKVGDRRPSDIAGWDAVTVTLISPRGNQPIELLISKDNKQMAHMERFNLDKVPGSNIQVEGRPVRGNPSAKVSVISFDDFQCPYCSVMHQKLFPTLLKEYGDRVKFIYKDYPLESIHPWAIHAAVNANCLAAQNSDTYWDYADFIHANQQTITKNEKGDRRPQVEQFNRLDDAARKTAEQKKLDVNKLNACIQKQDDTAVRASMKEGQSLDIDGTPTLFINGERIGGDTDIDNIRTILDRALVAAGEQPPKHPETIPAQPVNK